jgi:hypothetical protein
MGPPEQWLVWEALWPEKKAELERWFEEEGLEDNLSLGEEDIAFAVAEDERGLDELPEHYRRWDSVGKRFELEPALADQAIDTILKARKRLQKRRTEKASS